MNVCTKCGTQLEDGVQFCQSCGRKRESLAVKKKMSSGTKVGITILTLLAVVIVGLYLYGSSYYKQAAQVDRIITILQERNGEKLAEIVTADDPSVTVTRESLMPLFSYIKENPSYVNELKEQLRIGEKQGNGIERADFSLTKDGKYFFLFDRYKLKAKTYYTTLLTNEKGTSLKMNGKEIDKTDDKKFEKQYGPFLPGTQVFQAEYKNDYVKLSREEKVVLMKQGQNNVTIDLTLQGQYITVQTNVPGATLYVNQKPVTALAGEEITWGPVATDGSATIYLERNGESGRETTKVETVTALSSYNLPFEKKSAEKTVVYNVTPPPTTRYVYNGFIFPDSDIRKLTSAELTYLSKEQLKIARNEIYARHGNIFQTKDMQAYFSKQSWYRENPYFSGTLTNIESYNVELIKARE
ncbi:zinc ribbon domain-containing protein [Bacillus wiedmannii]|uniref:TcaA 3rd/4th domain-containing protein n=1 Tax=Bacillus TaxID=1386 RepID=UPI000BECEB52|nr:MULTISPECIES: YARHG domain-containing protein [Bacillus]AZJ19413.1 zinc ribbon domain-containing protein [Bacillus wiedmannii bv. thuringiensis]MCU5498282.1 YARHG domain-containing protein [Bacillus wiedmannii]MED2882836.1 YARHG domain-containing protein [Bacillus wiedmannii]PEC59501.1 zinc ribbon domain-containing protein [Bacillus wiedmannii]PEI36309.1 zinc ribbon domain-containing protein [Bacillus wiedmannii]